MAIRIRSALKNWFKTGDKPTQDQFADLIDSFYHRSEDSLSASADIALALNAKVDKIPGRELSSNDFTNAHKAKLDSISGTNLAYTVLGNTLVVTSDTGTDASMPLATTTTAGMMSKEDKLTLNSFDQPVSTTEKGNWNAKLEASALTPYLLSATAATSYVALSGSYADPAWLTGLAWSKVSSRPSTLAGYGIADAWALGGNATAAPQSLGSTGNFAVSLMANSKKILQLNPNSISPNNFLEMSYAPNNLGANVLRINPNFLGVPLQISSGPGNTSGTSGAMVYLTSSSILLGAYNTGGGSLSGITFSGTTISSVQDGLAAGLTLAVNGNRTIVQTAYTYLMNGSSFGNNGTDFSIFTIQQSINTSGGYTVTVLDINPSVGSTSQPVHAFRSRLNLSNQRNLSIDGLAPNYLAGNTSIGTVTNTALLTLGASSATRASLRLMAGTPPSSPLDGEVWYDGTNLYFRVGGTTKTFALT